MYSWAAIAAFNSRVKRVRWASWRSVAWARSCCACWPSAWMGWPRSRSFRSVWRTNVTKTRPCPRHWRPKARMTFFSSCCRCWAWLRRGMARRLHRWGSPSMRSRVFLSLIQRGGVGDPLAPWFTRESIDDEMGGADQTCFHRGRRLDGDEFIHQHLVDTATKLTERLWKYKVYLRARGLVLLEATGVHHGKVRTQAVADIFIGSTHFMFEQFQSQQHPGRNGGSTTRGAFEEACGKTVLDGGDQRGPRKGVGPLAYGMRVRHKVSDVQTRSCTAQPMLKIANKAHRAISS